MGHAQELQATVLALINAPFEDDGWRQGVEMIGAVTRSQSMHLVGFGGPLPLSLNLFVGIFNLLPLLPLDGGHIAVIWFEALRDRIKRARGYVGDTVRVDYNKLMPLTLAVVAVFVGFTVWVLGADIVNPIRINQ